MVTRSIGQATLELTVGDITTLEVDAVVNAANSALELGGGVAGAIRRGGGPEIQAECDRLGECPVGGAMVTGAGTLPARFVIHAVGPIWGDHSPEENDRLLASACREALARANERGLTSVALPSISSGIFGFPIDRAARVLLRETIAHLRGETTLKQVVFCLFDEQAFDVYKDALGSGLAF